MTWCVADDISEPYGHWWPTVGAVARIVAVLWRLTKETTAVCFRYRVTGLAAEAGFFALLSLPPLLLGLVGAIGYLVSGPLL